MQRSRGVPSLWRSLLRSWASVWIWQLCLRTPVRRAFRSAAARFGTTLHRLRPQIRVPRPRWWAFQMWNADGRPCAHHQVPREMALCYGCSHTLMYAAHEILKMNIYHTYWWNIPNIYLVYAILNVIYKVYTYNILIDNSIY